MVKNPPAMWENWVRYLGWDDPLEEGMATHSSILAWKIHEQRSLTGCSPQGRKESDTAERLSVHTRKGWGQGRNERWLLRGVGFPSEEGDYSRAT